VVSQVLEVTRPWRSQCVLISSDLAAIHRARRLGDAQSAGIERVDNHSRLKYEALQPQSCSATTEAAGPRAAVAGSVALGDYDVTTLPLARAWPSGARTTSKPWAVREMSNALRGLRTAQ